MKNHITLFPKRLGLGLLTVSLLASCSQDPMTEENQPTLDEQLTDNSFKEMILSTPHHPVLEDSQAQLLEEISKQVLLLAQRSDFKESIFTETVKQESGDYDIELSSLDINLKSHTQLSESLSQISSLSKQFENLSGGVKLILYYPRASTFEKQGLNPDFETKSQSDSPEIVIMNNYNEDYSSPAYQLDEKEELVFTQNVTEDYAANNNVYIIGSEAIATNDNELMLPDDPYSGGGGGSYTPTYTYRTEGRAEYGGKIQVTDMNAIEHWTAGKLELRVIVVSASGLIVKDKEFDQRARSNFSDKKWYDFNEFYYNWYQNNIGSFTVEKWIEMDSGGDPTETTINIPAAYEGGPTFSVKVSSSDNDEEMGQTIIQYNDRVGQSYGISHMNIQRQ